MSRYTADRVSQDIDGKPVLIRPLALADDKGSASVPDRRGLEAIRLIAVADPVKEIQAAIDRRAELISAYGFGVPSAQTEKPFCFVEGAAIIPVHGMLINRFPYSWGFATGYNFIRDQVNAAKSDPDVKLIVFDVNSYGGTVAGCQETADVIFESRGDKESIAVVDASCYSAAYYLASQAKKVVVTPSGGVGSIGVIAMRLDLSGMMAQDGIKVSMIHAGAFKIDGYPYAAMSDAEEKRIQASVDESYDAFVASVARGRTGMSEESIRDTEAGTFNPNDALRIGLVDAIVAPAAAVRDALCPPDDDEDPNQEDDTMTVKPGAEEIVALKPEDVAAAASAARTEERARFNGILNCEEAKGKSKLAAHLANSDISVDAAKAILTVASAEVVEKPAAEVVQDPLAAAMDRHGSPDVGAGGGSQAGGGTEDDAERIISLFAKNTGREILKRA